MEQGNEFLSSLKIPPNQNPTITPNVNSQSPNFSNDDIDLKSIFILDNRYQEEKKTFFKSKDDIDIKF